MSSVGFMFSRLRSGHNFLTRAASYSKLVHINSCRSFSSTGDALIEPKKNSVSANVDIVNYSLAGCFIVGYNEHGFQLSNAATIYGPMVSFPQNAFSWNINSAKDINDESISLFRVLCPGLDVLVIGKGAASEEINQREIMNMCWKYNLGVEILPTSTAIGVFNFLNAEGRYVAAGLIPPIRIDLLGGDLSSVKRLEAARDIQLNVAPVSKIRKLPKMDPSKVPKLLIKDQKE